MKGSSIAMAALALSLMAVDAGAELVIRPAPLDMTPHPGHAAGGGGNQAHAHGSGGERRFMLSSHDFIRLELMTPDTRSLPINVDDHTFALPKSGVDNYHAIIAERKDGDVTESAVRYVYRQGKPSGMSPSVLSVKVKTALEIVPMPIPREHNQYLSGRTAAFAVRFEGAPVPDVEMTLTTSNGSSIPGRTGADGKAVFTLPDDFTDVKPGRRLNKPAELTVFTALEKDGKKYTSTLGAEYHVNPILHWQISTYGFLMMAAGFAAGGAAAFIRRNGKEA